VVIFKINIVVITSQVRKWLSHLNKLLTSETARTLTF